MCISIVGSLISMLAPEGEGGGLGKNIRLCFGLCVVLVCINPIKEMADQIKSLDMDGIFGSSITSEQDYSEYFDASYSAAELDTLKDGVYRLLSDRYGIEQGECRLSVKLCEDEGQKNELESIYITLYGSAIFKNTGEIEEYLGELFGCEIITVIG